MSSGEHPAPDDRTSAGPQGQSAGDSAMPSFPQAPPAQPGSSREPVAQPASIHTAVRLMWAGAAISVLSLIVTLVTLGSLKTQIRDQLVSSGQEVTDSTINAGYAAAIIFAVVSSLVAIGLWLWMAWKNGQGRSWARVVATVLAAINLVSTLISLFGGNAMPLATIVTVVNLILAIVIVVLLWRKESSDFYAACSRPSH